MTLWQTPKYRWHESPERSRQLAREYVDSIRHVTLPSWLFVTSLMVVLWIPGQYLPELYTNQSLFRLVVGLLGIAAMLWGMPRLCLLFPQTTVLLFERHLARTQCDRVRTWNYDEIVSWEWTTEQEVWDLHLTLKDSQCVKLNVPSTALRTELQSFFEVHLADVRKSG